MSKNPQRIAKEDKKLVSSLNYKGIEFLVSRKIIAKLKIKTIFVLMCFVMKMG